MSSSNSPGIGRRMSKMEGRTVERPKSPTPTFMGLAQVEIIEQQNLREQI
jgi:hypothetical protein